MRFMVPLVTGTVEFDSCPKVRHGRQRDRAPRQMARLDRADGQGARLTRAAGQRARTAEGQTG